MSSKAKGPDEDFDPLKDAFAQVNADREAAANVVFGGGRKAAPQPEPAPPSAATVAEETPAPRKPRREDRESAPASKPAVSKQAHRPAPRRSSRNLRELVVPAVITDDLPMPALAVRHAAKVQFNNRIDPEIMEMLQEFWEEYPARKQDTAELALLEFGNRRGFYTRSQKKAMQQQQRQAQDEEQPVAS